MGKKGPDFDSILSTDKNFVSKGTLDQRSKEKKESNDALKQKNDLIKTVNEYKKQRDENLKNFTQYQDLEKKINLEINGLKNSINALGNGNPQAKKDLEKRLKEKETELKKAKNIKNNFALLFQQNDKKWNEVSQEYHSARKKHDKEKQEFEIANKKAIDEFRKNVEKNNERAQKQSEYNKLNSEIKTLDGQITKLESDLKTKRIELKNKENELNREKATTNTYVRELANLYRDAGLVIGGKDPSKADPLSLISDGNLKILKGKYTSNNQILNNINTKANRLKINLQIQPTINKLKTEISNLENQKTNLISQKTQKENSKNAVLTTAKQKGINLV